MPSIVGGRIVSTLVVVGVLWRRSGLMTTESGEELAILEAEGTECLELTRGILRVLILSDSALRRV